jgi:hypothetical protein
MDKPEDSVSGAKNKTAFLESLGNRLTSLTPGATLGNRFARLSRWLVGVDPRVLVRCSKAQQTLYSATAIIMIVAALLTAAGVSTKLSALWGAGTIVTMVLFGAVLALALAMEAAVLASISPTANPWTTIAVRVPIGMLLVAMQVVPTLTNMLSARLDLALHEQNLTQQMILNAQSAKLLNVTELKGAVAAREKVVTKALEEQANPVADPAVQAAQADADKATAAVKRAQTLVQKAKTRVANLSKSFENARDTTVAERIKAALEKSKVELTKANGIFSQADVDQEAKELALKAAKDAQAIVLATAVQTAKGAVEAGVNRLTSTEAMLEVHKQKAEQLSAAATTANFITQVTTLFKLAVSDFSVGITCLGTLLAFALLDLLPTAIKLGARKGLYAQLVALQDQQVQSAAARDAVLQQEEDKQTLAVKANQTRGVELFTKQDNGALAAQLLLLEEQYHVDTVAATASPQVILATLQGLTPVIETLIQQKAALEQHPDIAPAYQQQLASLLQELQARADKLVSQLKSGGGDAEAAVPVGA